MRILYVSTEVYPALKTGGLADVNAALPRALIEAGVDVRLLLPASRRYRFQFGNSKQPVCTLPDSALPLRLDHACVPKPNKLA